MTAAERTAIQERMDALYAKHGDRLTPAVVLREAKRADSPLHSQFEWDDTVAAKKWREEQARVLIRWVVFEERTETTVVRSVAYVRDPNAPVGKQGYIHVKDLRNDPTAARQALIYECTMIAGMLQRVRNIALVLGMADDVDEILAEVSALKAAVE